MKKISLLLVLIAGSAVACFFYFRTKDEPILNRSSLDTGVISPAADKTMSSTGEKLTFDRDVSSVDIKTHSGRDQVQAEGKGLAEFKKNRTNNIVAQLRDELYVLMSTQGFTQNEIDQTATNLSQAFLYKEGDTVKLSAAIDSTAAALNLDTDRSQDLTNSVVSAVGNITSRFTYTEFQTCINLRTASASNCAKDLAQELAQKVAIASEADVLNSKAIFSLESAGLETVKRAVDICGEDLKTAEAYYKVNLSGCL